jgi:hypothetical protein
MNSLRHSAGLVLLGLIAALQACGGSSTVGSGASTGEACVEGKQPQCTCDDGAPGAHLCVDGVYTECQCTQSNPCGNGTIDMGESCDGANLNGETCASATMNAMPLGTLQCSSTCATFDISDCSAGQSPGAGGTGTAGTGGTTGEGGTTGSGGLFGSGGTF